MLGLAAKIRLQANEIGTDIPSCWIRVEFGRRYARTFR